MLTILVTGGTGMTGKALQRLVSNDKLTNYVFVGSKDADLTNYEQTKLLFEHIKPTIVIHLASVVGGLFYNLDNNALMLDANTRIHLNVMKCCCDFRVSKVISALSTCAFPSHVDKYPMTEDDIHRGPVHSSNEGYGESKRIVEILSRLYSKICDTKFLCLFPCNLYGLEDNFSEKGHVLSGLISKCYQAKYNFTDFIVYGSGKPLRQFLFVDDFARIIVELVDKFDSIKDESLIICNDNDELSIQSLAMIIKNTVGYQGNIINDSTKSDGLGIKTVSNAKFRSYFPTFKFMSLEDGIKKTCDWYVEKIFKFKITGNVIDHGLSGGIGNQLFNVATTLTIAWEKGLEPFFRYYGNTGYSYCNDYRDNAFRKLKFDNRDTSNYFTIVEPQNQENIDIDIPDNCNIQLNGYFQNAKYFDRYKDRLKRMLYVDDNIELLIVKILEKFNCKKLIGVQCRRGDYAKLGWLLPLSYYVKAMQKFSDCEFVFFSDDIHWCKKVFPGHHYCSTGNDYIDFLVLMRMNGVIMSNSTFSWWACYLSDMKKVICPYPWFKNHSYNKNIYVDNWELLEY